MPAPEFKYTVSKEGIIEAHRASALPEEGENGRGLLYSRDTVVKAAIECVQKAQKRRETANDKETLRAYLLRLISDPERILDEAETKAGQRR